MNQIRALNFLATALCLLILTACATTHPGNEGRSVAPNPSLPIKISAQTIGNPVGEAFQLVEITYENLSDNWFRLNHSQVVIDDVTANKLSVVVGKDLVDWAQAMHFRLQKDQYNEQMAQAALITAGAIASSGKNSNNVGATLLVGGTAWAVADTMQFSYSQATQTAKIPENHIGRPFSIPGKMFMRKWVLLNKPTQSAINKLVVELETVEGKKGLYEVAL